MTEKTYEGRGKTSELALRALNKAAKEDAIVTPPKHVDYTCVIYAGKAQSYTGAPDPDYTLAFADALQKSKLTIQDFKRGQKKDPSMLEVIAQGSFILEKAAKAQPQPSGAAPGRRTYKNTDLF